MDDLLPIGTIINLERDVEFHHMIIGYYPINSKNGKIYDYVAVLFPYGIEDENSLFLLNKDDIAEVIYRGFSDKEGKQLITCLPIIMMMNEEGG